MTEARIDYSKKHPSHIAYTVKDGKDGQKGHWSEIGACWQTKDGRGYILHLNAVPIDGRVILQPVEKRVGMQLTPLGLLVDQCDTLIRRPEALDVRHPRPVVAHPLFAIRGLPASDFALGNCFP